MTTLTALKICADNYVEGIQEVYEDQDGNRQDKSLGKFTKAEAAFLLDKGETVQAMEGVITADNQVSQLVVITNVGRKFGPFGTDPPREPAKRNRLQIVMPPGNPLHNLIEYLALYMQPSYSTSPIKLGPCGGVISSDAAYDFKSGMSDTIEILKLTIRYDTHIKAYRAEYPGGTVKTAGIQSDSSQLIDLTSQKLVQVSGQLTSNNRLCQTYYTTDSNSYGPYGSATASPNSNWILHMPGYHISQIFGRYIITGTETDHNAFGVYIRPDT